MKKAVITSIAAVLCLLTARAQETNYQEQLQAAVSKLSNASAIADYQVLANDFIRIADAEKTDWLSYYYAAFCNAKIGWLNQDNADRIEPFARLSLEQIKKSQSLLDPATQQTELSEVYCVMSMAYRAHVFIDPMTNGKKYGQAANKYIEMAKQLDPANPRALYLDGWLKYYAPKMWGGDKKQAKFLLEDALKKLETAPASSTSPAWGKKECEALLDNYKK